MPVTGPTVFGAPSKDLAPVCGVSPSVSPTNDEVSPTTVSPSKFVQRHKNREYSFPLNDLAGPSFGKQPAMRRKNTNALGCGPGDLESDEQFEQGASAAKIKDFSHKLQAECDQAFIVLNNRLVTLQQMERAGELREGTVENQKLQEILAVLANSAYFMQQVLYLTQPGRFGRPVRYTVTFQDPNTMVESVRFYLNKLSMFSRDVFVVFQRVVELLEPSEQRWPERMSKVEVKRCGGGLALVDSISVNSETLESKYPFIVNCREPRGEKPGNKADEDSDEDAAEPGHTCGIPWANVGAIGNNVKLAMTLANDICGQGPSKGISGKLKNAFSLGFQNIRKKISGTFRMSSIQEGVTGPRASGVEPEDV